LPARFHAHLILGLAGRPGVILHAGALLVAANFAAWLLGPSRVVGGPIAEKYDQHYRRKAHDWDFSPGSKRKRSALVLAVLSSAARNPLASFTASSLAQKCRKYRRGCS